MIEQKKLLSFFLLKECSSLLDSTKIYNKKNTKILMQKQYFIVNCVFGVGREISFDDDFPRV